MGNCTLEATQIESLMALNARNHKIFKSPPRNLSGGFTVPPATHPTPGPLAARALILQMSAFVTKIDL